MASSRSEVSLKERIAALQTSSTSRSNSPKAKVALDIPKTVLTGEALRERIARFDGLGGTPIPRGSFGLGAPPPHGRRVSNELWGNRIVSAGNSPTTPRDPPRHRTVSTSAAEGLPPASLRPRSASIRHSLSPCAFDGTSFDQPVNVSSSTSLPAFTLSPTASRRGTAEAMEAETSVLPPHPEIPEDTSALPPIPFPTSPPYSPPPSPSRSGVARESGNDAPTSLPRLPALITHPAFRTTPHHNDPSEPDSTLFSASPLDESPSVPVVVIDAELVGSDTEPSHAVLSASSDSELPYITNSRNFIDFPSYETGEANPASLQVRHSKRPSHPDKAVPVLKSVSVQTNYVQIIIPPEETLAPVPEDSAAEAAIDADNSHTTTPTPSVPSAVVEAPSRTEIWSPPESIEQPVKISEDTIIATQLISAPPPPSPPSLPSTTPGSGPLSNTNPHYISPPITPLVSQIMESAIDAPRFDAPHLPPPLILTPSDSPLSQRSDIPALSVVDTESDATLGVYGGTGTSATSDDPSPPLTSSLFDAFPNPPRSMSDGSMGEDAVHDLRRDSLADDTASLLDSVTLRVEKHAAAESPVPQAARVSEAMENASNPTPTAAPAREQPKASVLGHPKHPLQRKKTIPGMWIDSDDEEEETGWASVVSHKK
ncbi:hypothetical protein BOTBODRAFT_66478 [Botryobasidium botryosum FD-172 SS1]|uniref:Uncharacterized protein n=1 Tax=Botryobasidium botryosum (strain FD-172 SS1) TaxID=930990 RepID=A0A067MH42_BOTB1|nr:hypothetical protein BOTBODRAFT_66478 [Botryobasidium botryosum FD-172 SS1]